MTIPDPWTLISTPAVEVLGWTLLHFVWQGALVATLLVGALWALQRYGPRVRYSVSLAALTALFALPVVTGVLLYGPVASGPSETIAVAVPEIATEAATSSEGVLARADGAARETWTAQVSEWVHPTLPWVVFAWTLGVLVLGARWFGGARRVRRLRRSPQRLKMMSWQSVMTRRSGGPGLNLADLSRSTV